MTRTSGHMRIVLATYDGATHLAAQLQSYCDQSHGDWSLMVSDDGSRDDTRAVLADFAAAQPARVAPVIDGPGRGSAANFLSLLVRAVNDAPGNCVAFSDQDDVWLPGKLARAAAWMQANGADQGARLAWVCRTVLVDAALTRIGESRLFHRPPAFGNALVQNILAGNTIVLSPAAAQIVAQSVPGALAADVPYHDWWIYQMITGMGGQIGMEPEPLVLYRQHSDNHMGHHDPFRGRVARIGMVMRRHYAGWLDANLAGLETNAALLTSEHRQTVQGFVAARAAGGRRLARALRDLGLHRQTRQGDRGLRLMALAGRM